MFGVWMNTQQQQLEMNICDQQQLEYHLQQSKMKKYDLYYLRIKIYNLQQLKMKKYHLQHWKMKICHLLNVQIAIYHLLNVETTFTTQQLVFIQDNKRIFECNAGQYLDVNMKSYNLDYQCNYIFLMPRQNSSILIQYTTIEASCITQTFYASCFYRISC